MGSDRNVQVIEKDSWDDRISTSDLSAPKPLSFRLILMRLMPWKSQLAIDSLATDITVDMKIPDRMGDDRR